MPLSPKFFSLFFGEGGQLRGSNPLIRSEWGLGPWAKAGRKGRNGGFMDVLVLILLLVTGLGAPSTDGTSETSSVTTSSTTTEPTLSDGGDGVRKQPIG